MLKIFGAKIGVGVVIKPGVNIKYPWLLSIGDYTWVGAKSVVCPDVHVESHAFLTVQSVATKNMEAYGIYQGSPAMLVRKREISRSDLENRK